MTTCDGGVMVSIVAFQAVDPSSILGHRIFTFYSLLIFPGYYADPENCRWFFACLDHGKSPLSAYEFRCPFGLVYDESRLLCEWPWLVPKCASGYAVASHTVYGGAGSIALDQYDGLGVLGVTSLGGLHGPLQQPEAKIYSNVGLVSQGQNYLAGKLLFSNRSHCKPSYLVTLQVLVSYLLKPHNLYKMPVYSELVLFLDLVTPLQMTVMSALQTNKFTGQDISIVKDKKLYSMQHITVVVLV
jgi:hypothetical protein